MYQNPNHRRRPSSGSPKPLAIRLDPITFEEKAAYVESVCATLIDSRFGTKGSGAFIIDLAEWPEYDEIVFNDLMINEVAVPFAARLDPDRFLGHADETCHSKSRSGSRQTELASHFPHLPLSASPRGSPGSSKTFGTRAKCGIPPASAGTQHDSK